MSGSSHPNIAKITRQIETIDAYYARLLYYEAWGLVLVVMRGLKPEHKAREDFKALMSDILYGVSRINRIRFRNAHDRETKRILLAARLDKDFHSRFMSLLWDCKMLSEGSYDFFDPSEGKKSGAKRIKLGRRNTDGIR